MEQLKALEGKKKTIVEDRSIVLLEEISALNIEEVEIVGKTKTKTIHGE